MRTRVLLLIAMIAGARMLYDAGSPPPHEEAEVRFNLAGGTGITSRVRHGVGVYGAILAEPAVNELLRAHARDLAELEAASRNAPPARRTRTAGALHRVQELDSLALARIEDGSPVIALQYALQAGGLIEAVRDVLIEERLIR